MTGVNPPSWRNPRILLTLVLVFLCGATVGMLTMSLAAPGWAHRSQPSWKESDKEISLQRLKKELDLSASQAEELETVLDDFFMYYHTLQAQLDDVRGTGKQRILHILDHDQKRKFDQLMTELQAKQLR